jgi:NAD-dependent dihydropyrimidine dehydrogenase PreA subunit
MLREIVKIDEDLCDGCGLCVPSCEEGAIKIIDGKARLISDRLCDGLGACLGHCPRGAIRIEKREAAAFDEEAVAPAMAHEPDPAPAAELPIHGGCPGSRMQQFHQPPVPVSKTDDSIEPVSELMHWPVQLRLLPPQAPVLREAQLLIAADCVPVAYASFQAKLLRGRAVLIGCPKFDDIQDYTDKLAAIIRENNLREIVVARMQVPCCLGIVMAVAEARRRAGSVVPIREVVIGVHGELLSDRCLEEEGCKEAV